MKKTLAIITAMALLAFAGTAQAVSTTVGAKVARGNSDSTAYTINITQSYEPWLVNELFQLTPTAELGGHAWVDDDSDVDTVWGAYLAPGLRFSLFTDAPIQPFLEGSVGGAVNSKSKIDERDLGSRVLIRSRGSLGLAFGDGYRHRVQGDVTNYSTWGITSTDDGYNTYGISYGYSF